MELRREGHTQHVRVGRIVDVVVDIFEPTHLRQELGSSEGFIALFDL